MDRLRIGVIGLGWFGEIHCDAIIGISNLELAALCTRTESRLGEMAAKFGVKKTYTDYHKLLADPDIDAVSIVTMWDQHTDPTVAALQAGKHVFLEKPMASTVADCRTIIAAAAKSKGILQIGHICRFNPRYRAAKEAIAAGKIGKIVSLASRRNIPAAWTPTILNKIGPIVGDAIHDTDLMLWFTEDRVVSAYAQTVDVRGLKHPDIGQTMYRFAGGATATLETVWCMPEKTPYDIDERMNIVGTTGFIQIQDTFPNLGIASGDKFHSPDTTYWPMFEGVRGGALRDELSYFANCALKGIKPKIGTPEDAMAALEATLAAEESARTGQVVRIGPSGTIRSSRTRIDELWHSSDPKAWQDALDRYWDLVPPKNKPLERSLDALDLERLRHLDAQGWYDFLEKEYFRWKYTAPNRYATTTSRLRHYVDDDSLDDLDRIRTRLLAIDPSDICAGLEAADSIKGLGTAGASGLLALMYPEHFGTVDQFLVKALRHVHDLQEAEALVEMDPDGLTIRDGVLLVGILRRKAAENNRVFKSDVWTPRMVDKVLWAVAH